MNLHGADIFLMCPDIPDVPKEVGKFSLVFISNRGTRVYPPPAPEVDLLDWSQCRYLSDQEATDAEIDDLVQHLSKAGWTWTKCQKLFKKDGVNQFSQPY